MNKETKSRKKNPQQHKFALEIDFAQLLSEFAGIPNLYKRSVVGGGGVKCPLEYFIYKKIQKPPTFPKKQLHP